MLDKLKAAFRSKIVVDKTKFSDEEILKDLIKNENSHTILQNKKEDLIGLHFSLGRSIRNDYGLWLREFEPEVINGIDESPNHPDAISQRIIERLHEYWELHPEELTKRKNKIV